MVNLWWATVAVWEHFTAPHGGAPLYKKSFEILRKVDSAINSILRKVPKIEFF